MSSSPDSLIGATVQGRYRILEFVAEGAMGAVYSAERIGLERKVAIKFLNPAFAANAQAKGRFEREARAMSRLDHPNCVSVIDFGVSPVPYIVMEYVTGVTLRASLDEGAVSVDRALYLCRRILAALAHAHKKGIIHRDIKPANVMITEAAGTEDLVRILDFGLAKLRDGTPSDISASWVVLGTPSYMSPEQSLGSNVDSRTDLYATGVVLFELLTGKKPYQGDEAFETLRLQRESSIPTLADTTPDREFPDGLQELLEKALAKDPKERFVSASEFSDAIGALVSTTRNTLEVTEEDTVEQRGRGWSALVYLILLLVAVGAITASGIGPLASQSRSSKTTDVPITAEKGEFLGAEDLEESDVIMAVDALKPIVDAGASRVDAGTVDGAIADSMVAVADSMVAVADSMIAIADGPASNTVEGLAPKEPLPGNVLDGGDKVLGPEEVLEQVELDPPLGKFTEIPSANVNSVADAILLIKDGSHEAAISGLRQLLRKHPRNAQAAYVLGNLYFDKLWWSVALVQYEKAIGSNRKYKRNSILITNSIAAMGSMKTRGKAQRFLRLRVGRVALPRLRRASKKDKNPLVRSGATQLVRQMTVRKKKRRGSHSKKERRPQAR